MRIAGWVLAGGRSRRFGAEKAMAMLDGRPMIEHVTQVLERGCEQVVVNAPAASAAARWALERGLDVKSDHHGPHRGPLLGVLTGLEWMRAADFDLLVTAPCDVPLLPADYVWRLVSAVGERAGAVATDGGEHIQPLCAIWRSGIIGELEAALRVAHPAVREFVSAQGFATVMIGDPGGFANVNKADDLECLRQIPPRLAP